MPRRLGQARKDTPPLADRHGERLEGLDAAAVAVEEAILEAEPQRPDLDANGKPLDPEIVKILDGGPARRMAAILRVLEKSALLGDSDSAKAALMHARWRVEMKQGKAPIRGSLDVRHGVTVLDDLGHRKPDVELDVAGQRKRRTLSPVAPLAPLDVVLSPDDESGYQEKG